MDKVYLKFFVDGQIITRKDSLTIVGGTQNYHFAEFDMSGEWEGLHQTAVFRANGVKPIGVEIRNGQCEVPWEVLMRTEFFVGVFAGERITTNTVRVPVGTPVSINSVPGVQPTPSAYENLVKRTEDALSKVPTIGKNDHWWVYDAEAGAYVDSGVYAGGSAPYIGANGTWFVGEVDTGVSATGPKPTVWQVVGELNKSINGKGRVELYKDGALYNGRAYLVCRVSTGGTDFREHGTSKGYFTGTKSWTWAGTKEGIVWRCDVYADDSRAELLASCMISAGPAGQDGSDASVTAENISKALGYTPVNGSGGTAGQFAVSDGSGGITWLSLTNVGEVGA